MKRNITRSKESISDKLIERAKAEFFKLEDHKLYICLHAVIGCKKHPFKLVASVNFCSYQLFQIIQITC